MGAAAVHLGHRRRRLAQRLARHRRPPAVRGPVGRGSERRQAPGRPGRPRGGARRVQGRAQDRGAPRTGARLQFQLGPPRPDRRRPQRRPGDDGRRRPRPLRALTRLAPRPCFGTARPALCHLPGQDPAGDRPGPTARPDRPGRPARRRPVETGPLRQGGAGDVGAGSGARRRSSVRHHRQGARSAAGHEPARGPAMAGAAGREIGRAEVPPSASNLPLCARLLLRGRAIGGRDRRRKS